MRAVAILWILGTGVAERSELHLAGAEDALATGSGVTARQELAAAWVYLGGTVFARRWQGAEGERRKLRDRWDEAQGRLLALDIAPRVAGLEKAALGAIEVARRSRRPRAVLFQSAGALAADCEQAVPADARTDWTVPGIERPLAEMIGNCRSLAERARIEGEEAAARAQARDQELRAVLRGERLDLYQRFGDPEPGMAPAAEVARAPVWTFVVGPSGPLRSYETWTFEFQGDRVTARRRVSTRGAPK